jgi:hypothetical protein
MAKPTVLPRWNTDASNRTTPSSGQLDTGWTLDQVPPSSYLNWFMFYVYSWLLWLDGLFTTGTGLTMPVDESVILSGTGSFKHGNMILVLPAGAGEANSLSSTVAFQPSVGSPANAWRGGGSTDIVVFPIPLKVGDRIKEVRAMIFDTTGGHTMSMQLRKSTSANANTQVGSTQTSAGNATAQTLAITGLTSTIASGDYYNITVQNTDATTTTNATYGVEVTYDRP